MTPSKRTQPLSRDEVVNTALCIVDADGLDALSMRRLGAALGVEAMALYRHVANKEELLDLTVDRMRSELHLEERHSDEPAELLAAIFVEYRRVLANHPNMLPLAARRTVSGAPSGLDYLIAQGLDSDDAVELYQSLLAFTIGFSLLGSEGSGGQWAGVSEGVADRLGEWREETFARTLRAVMKGYGL
jgi:TetR/AcrR family tetracycline transcriptional repressor